MFSTFYTKPGESLQTNKIYDRPLVLVASKKNFNHFVDYTTEAHRMAILAEKEAKRLAEVKKATYEMSKTWNNTVENVKKQRDEQLLAKSKKEDAQRIQFLQEMAAKKAAKHEEIIKEAKKLLLYRKSPCRLINSALFTSECLRELDAQLRFQKNLKKLEKEQAIEYAKIIRNDFEKHEKEEKKKSDEQAKKKEIYAKELKKQIEANERNSRQKEIEVKIAEKQDMISMSKELELIKKCEIEETEKRKKELKDLFLDALEKKKNHDLKVKRDQEFQERAMAVYNRGKRQIERKIKDQVKKEKEQKIRRSEYIAKRCAAIVKSRSEEEELLIKKALKEKEAAENEKREARKRYEDKLRAEMNKYRQELVVWQEKQKKDDEELKEWETLQKFKKEEYDKEKLAKDFEIERQKKQKNAESLRKQIALKEAEQKRIEALDDDFNETKKIIEKTNEEILRYGEEVLKESEGVRPLFPIIKAVEQFKKEIGLKPHKIPAEPPTPCKKKKWQQKKRPVCARPIPESQICYM